MSEKSHLSIAAFVSGNERAAVQSAAGYIARAMSEAAGVPWTCDCVFKSDLKSLQQDRDAAIIVTSFLPELEKMEEPWPQVEQRLRTAYTSLSKRGTPVFICTVLRHVGQDVEPETAAALRIRIRRLNLLAAEISRETRAYVIDLDRVLADIGARRLETDYRLVGNAAAEMAGHFIALTLVNNALDAFVSFEVQDAAGALLTSSRPAIAGLDRDKPEVTLWKGLLPIGKGRRKQIASPVMHTVQEDHAGWLVRQVLRGTISPAEALDRLVQAVRRRGFWETIVLFTTGLSRQITRKK